MKHEPQNTENMQGHASVAELAKADVNAQATAFLEVRLFFCCLLVASTSG
jgi:hypothetical protein